MQTLSFYVETLLREVCMEADGLKIGSQLLMNGGWLSDSTLTGLATV